MANHVGRLVLATTLIGVAGCGGPPPEWLPLTFPFPLTDGGTAVPAHGVSLEGQVTAGRSGWTLDRRETIGAGLGFGIWNRLGLSVSGFGVVQPPGRSARKLPGGLSVSAWGRAGGLLGPRTSTKVKLTLSWAGRTDLPAQDEVLRSLDLAVPTEWRWRTAASGGRSFSHRYVALYGGPRVTRARYSDVLRPSQTLRANFYGAVGGVHLSWAADRGAAHLFAETTVAHMPTATYGNHQHESRLIVVPAVGAAIEWGRPHAWP